MKNPTNEYEFQKLNADFDKRLDRLSDEYKRKADEIFHADRNGLDMKKRRNRLWMWFDRKTGYQIVPKIVIISFGLTVILLSIVMVLLLRYDMETSFFNESGRSLSYFGSFVGGRNRCIVSGPSRVGRLSPTQKHIHGRSNKPRVEKPKVQRLAPRNGRIARLSILSRRLPPLYFLPEFEF